MSEVDAKLEAIIAAVEAVRRSVTRLEGSMKPEARCLTYTEAAQRLGIGLTKLKKMVRTRQVLTADIGGRPKVPVSEIDRLLTPATAPPPRAVRRGKKQQPNQDPRALETLLRRR